MQILRTYRALFLLVLVTRLGMVWYVYPDVERIYNGDSHLYEQYALSMLETGTYLADGYATASTDPFADMIRPPGLPVVIALVYGVFGAEVGPWVVSLLSALMSLVVLYLLLVFFRVSGLEHRWPVLFIFAVDPVWVMYSKEILTEPFFVPLILGAIIVGYVAIIRLLDGSDDKNGFVEHRRERIPNHEEFRFEVQKRFAEQYLPGLDKHPMLQKLDVRRLFLIAGALLGLSALFKPITFYAPWAGIILLIGIYLVNIQSLRLSRVFVVSLLVFFVASQMFIFSWQVRNFSHHQTLAFTSIKAENMMTGHAAFVLARAENLTHNEAQNKIREIFRSRYPDHGSYTFEQLSDAKTEVSSEILSNNKWGYTVSILRGMAISMMDPGRLVVSRTFDDGDGREIGLTNTIARDGLAGTVSRLFRENPGTMAFMVLHMVYLGIIALLAMWGFICMVKRYPLAAVFMGCVFLYLLVLGGPSGYARFRLYLLPWMLIFLAYVDFKALFRR